MIKSASLISLKHLDLKVESDTGICNIHRIHVDLPLIFKIDVLKVEDR